METNRQPFQDTVDTAIFYGGGARREIVDNIKAALADEVQLLTLTGTDGSGKTMICRMVEQELQGSAEVLFFEQGAESFDEVVNRIAAHVELEETEQEDRNTRLEKAVEILNQQNRRLILIVDGAEKIFLATLERIRRMLDQVNSSRLAIQLLISGRPLFALNFKQLAIINFKVIEEQHFSLDPLDGRATHLYLNHCLDQSDTEEQKRFSLSQAEEIADIARGNFKLINQLARKLLDLKRLAGEKEEAVEDYDDGADLPGEPSRLTGGLANVDLDFLKVPRLGVRWYAAGAGIVVLILIIALFRGGDEEDTVERRPGAESVPELTLEKVEPDPIEIPEPSTVIEPLQPPAPTVAAEAPQTADAESSPQETPPETAEATQEPVAPGATEPPPEAAQDPSGETNESLAMQEPVVQESTEPPPAVSQDLSGETDESLDVQEPSSVSAPESESIPETARPATQGAEAVRSVEEIEETGETVESVIETREQRSVAQSGQGEEKVAEAPVRQPIEESVEREEGAIGEQSAAAPDLAAQSAEGEAQPAEEPASVPRLTVLPKKLPSTEPAPVAVVTLQEESKIRPDLPAGSVETEPPQSREPAPTSVAEAEDEPSLPEPRSEQVAALDRSAERAAELPETGTRVEVPARDSSVYYAQRLAAGSR